MPRYTVGHLARVERIEAALAGRALVVAGAAYHGVGLPDCIADARAKARALALSLGGVAASAA
jgi:oxygen-dependent protoporphyrinogen oxidase